MCRGLSSRFKSCMSFTTSLPFQMYCSLSNKGHCDPKNLFKKVCEVSMLFLGTVAHPSSDVTINIFFVNEQRLGHSSVIAGCSYHTPWHNDLQTHRQITIFLYYIEIQTLFVQRFHASCIKLKGPSSDVCKNRCSNGRVNGCRGDPLLDTSCSLRTNRK